MLKDTDISKLSSSDGPHRRHRHRHRRRRRKRRVKIPAPVVFYAMVALATLSSALVYLRGKPFAVVSALSCLLILLVLLVNERSTFSRSKRLRRPYETRVNFNKVEIFILFGLLMLGVYLSLVAWVA